MNWIRENKFLAVVTAVVVVCAGALGYLLYTAYDTYSDVSQQYTAQAAELHRLQSLQPYPDQGNLQKYQAEKQKVIDATLDLSSTLAQMEVPQVQMTPVQFQDRLRTSVSDITARAQKIGVKLPAHFYMGYDVYQTQPPRAEAAPALGRQLAAIEIAMNIVLDARVDTLTSLSRTLLPEEQGRAAGEPGGRGPGGRGPRGGGGQSGGGSELVQKNPFQIEVLSSQANLQKLLNSLAASSRQFFITRSLVILNNNPKPISKASLEAPGAPGDAGAAAGASPAPGAAGAGAVGAAGGATTDQGYLKFIVGTEKLAVRINLDFAVFNPPAAAPAKGGHARP